MTPDIRFGRGRLAAEFDHEQSPFVLLTQAPVVPSLPRSVVGRARVVEFVPSLDIHDLNTLLALLPSADIVLGVGGGVVMDAAKYVAWQKGCRLVLAPSVISADACVTNAVAVRRGPGVSYEGFVVADSVIVDPLVITTAPARFNRSGLGDLLSIHTAIFDWKLGSTAGYTRYDQTAASQALTTLEEIAAIGDQIAAVSDDAIDQIIRAYGFVNSLVVRAGHSQMQEGSEHYFAYAMEARTGRSFVHGEVLGLGAVLMSRLQNNSPERVLTLLRTCRVAWSPRDQGLSQEDIVQALMSLRAFVRQARLPYSIANVAAISRAAALSLVAGLDALGQADPD